jgi:hypothetical protein
MAIAAESAFPTQAPLISIHHEATLTDDEVTKLKEVAAVSREANKNNRHKKFKITPRPALGAENRRFVIDRVHCLL